jgi:hypothetical protein
MAGYPKRVQDKINSYIERLSSRYNFYKISDGYESSRDAQSDTTPVTTVYSNSTPSTGIIIYSDIAKTIKYDGGGLWYHVFNSSGSSLSLVVQINDKGIVIDESSF